jgi:hypothetical protein
MKVTVKDAARICHSVNKAYCESLGDFSLVPWDESPENIQDSAIDGVLYHIAHPKAAPSDSHNNWLRFKVEEGWVYGPVKNAETKEHPCILPYEELPDHQRAKDFIFRGLVHALYELGE